MSDGHFDAPAYCDLCDRPIATGPLCADCASHSGDNQADTDEWGGMTWEQRTAFVTLNLDNGNLTDAINFIMHDGDVRVDSVVLALRVLSCLILNELDVNADDVSAVEYPTDRLIRLIEHWETT